MLERGIFETERRPYGRKKNKLKEIIARGETALPPKNHSAILRQKVVISDKSATTKT